MSCAAGDPLNIDVFQPMTLTPLAQHGIVSRFPCQHATSMDGRISAGGSLEIVCKFGFWRSTTVRQLRLMEGWQTYAVVADLLPRYRCMGQLAQDSGREYVPAVDPRPLSA
jgi:hypothetical protein